VTSPDEAHVALSGVRMAFGQRVVFRDLSCRFPRGRISVILGRTRIPVANLLKMDVGTVVELDRQVGEAVEIFINERLVARGEIVLVENRLGVTMTEIIKAA